MDPADRLVARLAVEATPRGLSRIRGGRQRMPASAAARRHVTRARLQLLEYLAGRRTYFSVPVDLSAATPFQRRVLRVASAIAFGRARTYAWVAGRVGRPRASRAVGTALARNPLPLIVPCHRVLRGDGGLGGYLFGLDLKARLLRMEGSTPVLEGCASTRIFCRVGCIHGRHMRPENRVVFVSLRHARSAGYRACRVCRPERAG